MTMDRKIERPKWYRLRKKGAIGGAILAGVAALIIFSPDAARSLKVDSGRMVVSDVVRGQFEDFIPVRGRVTPLKTLYLDAMEGGRVERVLVEDGALVEKGELIVELSNMTLQLDIISRQAQITEQLNNLRNLELALERNLLEHKRNLVEINYQLKRLGRLVERRRSLIKRGNISKADLEDTEDEFEYYQQRRKITLESQTTDNRIQREQLRQLRVAAIQLSENLEFARRNLESLNVRAPVAGKLTALNAERGQSLSRGERLGRIDDPEGFKLSARIDEFYLGRIDIGQRVELDLKGSKYELKVAKVYPQVSNGQFELDMTFEGETPPATRRGQTLQVRLYLGDTAEAMMIPNGAFYQDTGGNWVFVVATDGTQAIKRKVRLGRRNIRYIEVLEGLEEGERVVTSPYTNFKDMDRLELKS